MSDQDNQRYALAAAAAAAAYAQKKARDEARKALIISTALKELQMTVFHAFGELLQGATLLFVLWVFGGIPVWLGVHVIRIYLAERSLKRLFFGLLIVLISAAPLVTGLVIAASVQKEVTHHATQPDDDQ